MYVLIFVKFVCDFLVLLAAVNATRGGYLEASYNFVTTLYQTWEFFNCVSLLCRGGALGESYVVSECTLVA